MKELRPKIAVVFDRKGLASAGHQGLIEIRVTFERKKIYLSSGHKVFKKQWDAAARCVCHRIDEDAINRSITEKIDRIMKSIDMVMETGPFTLDKLRMVLGGRGTGGDPLKWMEQHIERRPLTETTKRHHRTTLRLLRSMGIFRSWGDMTLANIMAFDEAVRARVSATATIACYHKQFRVYLSEAVRLGLLKDNPYRFFHIKRPDDSASIKYLTDEERSMLESVKLDGPLDKVRDLWVFCSYTGLSYSDMAKLSPSDIVASEGKKMIIDKRIKTGTPYKIVLLPKALAILDKYGGTLPVITNQKCNYFLKVIGPAAGIKKNLTMHMARHTFATWALSKGVRIEVVSKMLAHADITTTQIYAKVMQREVEKGYELLL